MPTRRAFLGALTLPAAGLAGAGPAFRLDTRGVNLAALAAYPGAPDDVARDENFWSEVARAFTVDRSMINLNNGGVSPAPATVQDAMKRHLDFSNSTPTSVALWQILEPRREGVRQQVARHWGVSPEEIAFTRNASESLQICQFGHDLKPGDEVLTTTHDYGRMLNTFRQRERREGIVMKQFSLPIPAEDEDEVVSLFEQNITPRTKVILMCHIVNITGQILPVRDVVQMARRKGVPVIVDGAHTFAHFPFTHADLDCDYYGTSLHKWLLAPIGTGFLYVRKDKQRGLWPLMAAPESMDDNIRKYEEIGTHPAANHNAISAALAFHQGIGAERKIARLRYLRDRWAKRLLAESDRVTVLTPLDSDYGGAIGLVSVDGIDIRALPGWLRRNYGIVTVPILHPEFEGLRVTPNVYTTVDEVDQFAEAMLAAIETGIE